MWGATALVSFLALLCDGRRTVNLIGRGRGQLAHLASGCPSRLRCSFDKGRAQSSPLRFSLQPDSIAGGLAPPELQKSWKALPSSDTASPAGGSAFQRRHCDVQAVRPLMMCRRCAAPYTLRPRKRACYGVDSRERGVSCNGWACGFGMQGGNASVPARRRAGNWPVAGQQAAGTLPAMPR